MNNNTSNMNIADSTVNSQNSQNQTCEKRSDHGKEKQKSNGYRREITQFEENKKTVFMVALFVMIGVLLILCAPKPGRTIAEINASTVANSGIRLEWLMDNREGCDGCKRVQSFEKVIEHLDYEVEKANDIAWKGNGEDKDIADPRKSGSRSLGYKSARDNIVHDPSTAIPKAHTVYKDPAFGIEIANRYGEAAKATRNDLFEKISGCKEGKEWNVCTKSEYEKKVKDWSCLMYLRRSLPSGPCFPAPEDPILLKDLENLANRHSDPFAHCMTYWETEYPDDDFNAPEVKAILKPYPWDMPIPDFCKVPLDH
jgi:hypothetical protein